MLSGLSEYFCQVYWANMLVMLRMKTVMSKNNLNVNDLISNLR
jgi:hypothetical protein